MRELLALQQSHLYCVGLLYALSEIEDPRSLASGHSQWQTKYLLVFLNAL